MHLSLSPSASSTAAALRIPDEILLQILSELAPDILAETKNPPPSGTRPQDKADYLFPTVYSHVCRKWMNIIRFTPQLWNKVVLFVDLGTREDWKAGVKTTPQDHKDLEKCRVHLDRCKDMPLDIKFTRLGRFTPALQLLLVHSQRWRHVNIEQSMQPALVEAFRDEPGYILFPNMRSLLIERDREHQVHPGPGRSQLPILYRAPNADRIALRGDMLDILEFPDNRSQFHDIQLHLNSRQLRTLLSQAAWPNLRRLSLRVYPSMYDRTKALITATQVAHLTSLKELDIQEEFAQRHQQFLRDVRCPSLEKLTARLPLSLGTSQKRGGCSPRTIALKCWLTGSPLKLNQTDDQFASSPLPFHLTSLTLHSLLFTVYPKDSSSNDRNHRSDTNKEQDCYDNWFEAGEVLEQVLSLTPMVKTLYLSFVTDDKYQGKSALEAADKVLLSLQLSDSCARVPLLEDSTILNLDRMSPRSILRMLATRRPTVPSIEDLDIPSPPTTLSSHLRSLRVSTTTGGITSPTFSQVEERWLSELTQGMELVVIDREIA